MKAEVILRSEASCSRARRDKTTWEMAIATMTVNPATSIGTFSASGQLDVMRHSPAITHL